MFEETNKHESELNRPTEPQANADYQLHTDSPNIKLPIFASVNQALELTDEYQSLSNLTETLRKETLLKPVIIMVGGHSGCGKSTLSRELADSLGMIHIQADAVRKHINNIDVHSKGPAEIYSPRKSQETFLGMAERAEILLRANIPVVLDGSFMAPYQRIIMEKLSMKTGIPMEGIWLKTDTQTQLNRVTTRTSSISDARAEVVESMARTHHNITPRYWHTVDTTPNLTKVLAEAERIVAAYKIT